MSKDRIIDKPSLVHIKSRRLLMVRSKNSNMFYIPGGKIEGNESPEESLVREVSEELSVRLLTNSIKPLFDLEAPAHGKPEGTVVRFACFSGVFEGEPYASNEIEEIRFLNSSNTDVTPEAGARILNKLKAMNLID